MMIQFTDFYYVFHYYNAHLLYYWLSRNYTPAVSVQEFIIFDQQSRSYFQIDQHSLNIQQVPQHHVAIIYQQAIFDIQYRVRINFLKLYREKFL